MSHFVTESIKKVTNNRGNVMTLSVIKDQGLFLVQVCTPEKYTD